MLHEFLDSNQQELIKRCKEKVAQRSGPPPRDSQFEYGVSLLIGQLAETLRAEEAAGPQVESSKLPQGIGKSAGKHGKELHRKGFTLEQVVHDYGDLCQAVTELAHEKQAPITVQEFHTFNRCLDNAIAEAVTEFGRQSDQINSEAGTQSMNERLGFLAHELRNKVNTAMLAFNAIKGGSAAVRGATGAVLDRSLSELAELIDRSLAEVRLNAGLQVRRESIELGKFLQEVSVFAVMEANVKGLVYTISVEDSLVIDADHQLLSSAVANLLQNALKFTPPGGQIWLRMNVIAERVLIEIEDQCGGLPAGQSEELFQPFEQRSTDRTGLGLGLSISRRGVEAMGGTLSVRDLPHQGCIFTIDLPRALAA